MKVYRIEKSKYKDVFPPRGSFYSDGRWNRKGAWVVYASENIALAKLEVLANSGNKIPRNRVLRIIELSDRAPILNIEINDLPKSWNATPYPKRLGSIISDIIETKQFVAAIVPSVLSRREKNILLFPDHPKFDRFVKQLEIDKEYFDGRLKG